MFTINQYGCSPSPEYASFAPPQHGAYPLSSFRQPRVPCAAPKPNHFCRLSTHHATSRATIVQGRRYLQRISVDQTPENEKVLTSGMVADERNRYTTSVLQTISREMERLSSEWQRTKTGESLEVVW